jgi:hypothetical protein
LKDLVISQAKTIETLKEKMKINDKMLELMNFKIKGLTSSMNNQLSFNERIETQLAQSAAIPIVDLGEILGQPETSLEYVKMVSMRFNKLLCQESQDHLIESPSITKKEDPSRPTITCSISPHVIDNAFYNLGASMNIMSKVTYDEILGGPLYTTNFQLHMAYQSLRKPEGVAKDVLVKIRDAYIPTDFVILDMGHKQRVPRILGRPILNTTNAVLHVGSGHVSFHMQGQTMRCPFNGFNKNKQPKTQPLSSVKQIWQAERSTSVTTSLDTDEPSTSKNCKEKSPAQRTLKGEPSSQVNGSYPF